MEIIIKGANQHVTVQNKRRQCGSGVIGRAAPCWFRSHVVGHWTEPQLLEISNRQRNARGTDHGRGANQPYTPRFTHVRQTEQVCLTHQTRIDSTSPTKQKGADRLSRRGEAHETGSPGQQKGRNASSHGSVRASSAPRRVARERRGQLDTEPFGDGNGGDFEEVSRRGDTGIPQGFLGAGRRP